MTKEQKISKTANSVKKTNDKTSKGGMNEKENLSKIFFSKDVNKSFLAKLIVFALLIYSVGISLYLINGESNLKIATDLFAPGLGLRGKTRDAIRPFASEADFKNYLAQAAGMAGGYGSGNATTMSALTAPAAKNEVSPSAPAQTDTTATAPERVSETNVQVAGIDEPDIVKTDGTNIFVSNENFYGIMPMLKIAPGGGGSLGAPQIFPQQYPAGKTQIVKAFPPTDLAEIGSVEKNGNLLLASSTLVVFSRDGVYGYDISDPANPKQKWNLDFDSNVSLAGARKLNDKIYLVIKRNINLYNPCPIRPFKGASLNIACNQIYHSENPSPSDITYTAMILNPDTGEIEKNISFVGAEVSSIMYMSPTAIYLTYMIPADFVKFELNFFEANKGLVPDSVVSRLQKLDGYDLSYNTKEMELSNILNQYMSSLSDDDRLKFQNDFNNLMQSYLGDHKRDLEKTGIARIGLDSFQIDGNGTVPGTLLNQYSMDEYKGNLRVATTLGQSGWWPLGIVAGQSQSVNDVYVLDRELKIEGSLKDLNPGERIYAVRFIDDKAYVVTYKQTDPFSVIDLSDPKTPVLKGELKIPGFSSYLYPVTKDLLIGVGQENNQVKVSLFDVSDPANPNEIAKYDLNEYWTEVSNNAHAFLLDPDHKIFFIPGAQGGYVFWYGDDNKLTLLKAVSDIQAKRALYIDDNFYIVGSNKIVVLDEINWQKVNEVDLE